MFSLLFWVVSIRQIKNLIDEGLNIHELYHMFNSVKEEFDDHLNAINENTLEIKDNYERIYMLDQKIEKLSHKLETTYMMVSELLKQKNHFDSITLTDLEQKVFLGIYTENGRVSYTVLSKKLGLKRSVIRLTVESLKKKAIPLFVQKEDVETYTAMEQRFKELQARENLIKIEEKNQKTLFMRDLRYFF